MFTSIKKLQKESILQSIPANLLKEEPHNPFIYLHALLSLHHPQIFQNCCKA